MANTITSTYHSVCPAIWLIELDKLGTRLAIKEARDAYLSLNSTTFPPTTTQGRTGLVWTISIHYYPPLGPEYGLDVLYLNESLNSSLDLSILSDVGVGLPLFLVIFIV